ncbi:hypothetical protein COEREDRAFT_86607 [Coemansia reversa NRRL 1564]|uniref:F-box domain-containing protein n=1 Tax=Coemansia reversa (strain ATCC 12441 / NRRL 1564) TaxID=763665 RepID=A0A2G5BCU8_COERN|nr:hypothetical protein COEREDRAFT_86607 [Coemansia reversa NRRL 1564]|eukprot:PIA16840.1 hypothetical protein COEREDRAFT_86607 [Coemansia reversa NRRL 1564]
MDNFSLLPELAINIFRFLLGGSDRTLKEWKDNLSLLAVCRCWRHLALPLVYKNLVIFVTDDENIPEIGHADALITSNGYEHMAKVLYINMESNIKLDKFIKEVNRMLETSPTSWNQIFVLDANLDCAVEVDDENDINEDENVAGLEATQKLAIQFVEHLPNLNKLDLMFYSEDDSSCEFANALEEIVLSYHSDMNIPFEDNNCDIYNRLCFPSLTNLRLRIRESEGRLLFYSHFPDILENLEIFHMYGGKVSVQRIKFGKRERQILAKCMNRPSNNVFWTVTNCLFGNRMQPESSTLTIFDDVKLPNIELLNWEYLSNLHIHANVSLSILQQLIPHMQRLLRLDVSSLVVDADSNYQVEMEKKLSSRQPLNNSIRFLSICFKDDTRIVRTTIKKIKQLVLGLTTLEAATLPVILPNITGFSRMCTSGVWAYHKRIGTPRIHTTVSKPTTNILASSIY